MCNASVAPRQSCIRHTAVCENAVMESVPKTPLNVLMQSIDAVLPQTQCRRCGHDGCAPYARAIVAGEPLNRCPPGGDATIRYIAAITDRAVAPLDPAYGVAAPLGRAQIDETACIGCTLCIDACPVDAITGGPKRMHSVIAALCTGCELCIAPCPVDCITLVPAGRQWTAIDAGAARERYAAWRARPRKTPSAVPREADPAALSPAERHEAVQVAIERARARRAARV